MRRSVALLLALLLALPLALALPAAAFAGGPVLAQDAGDDGEGGTEGTEEESGGEGQDDPATETGADESEEGEAAVEEGPVWTYQMAWITIGLLVLIGLGIAGAYYRLVAERRKSGI